MKVCKLAALVMCLLLLCSCTDASWVVGHWTAEDASGYSFELYEDGRCVMFDEAGEWVSEGTYKVRGSRILFETDTGNFTWEKTEGGMLFDNGDTVLHYYLGE